MRKQVKINMDNMQRISLTRLLSKEERQLFSSFRAYKEDDGRIILEPLIEVSAKDHWIYKNPEALSSLMRGIKEAEEGHISQVDIDFSQFLDDEDKKHVRD